MPSDLKMSPMTVPRSCHMLLSWKITPFPACYISYARALDPDVWLAVVPSIDEIMFSGFAPKLCCQHFFLDPIALVSACCTVDKFLSCRKFPSTKSKRQQNLINSTFGFVFSRVTYTSSHIRRHITQYFTFQVPFPMKFSIARGAAIFALFSLAISAPTRLLTNTAFLRDLPQSPVDIPNEERNAQLVVPQLNSMPPSKPTTTSTHNLPIATISRNPRIVSHANLPKDAPTPIHNRSRDVVEASTPDPPDANQKGANGKPIEASQAPSDTLTEENNKHGEVHGGCKESHDAKPIARREDHIDLASSASRGVRWDC